MKTKQAAMQAARKKLGQAANEGVDFTCTNTGAGWTWAEIPAANEPAVKAKAKRAPKPVTLPKAKKVGQTVKVKGPAIVKAPATQTVPGAPMAEPAAGTKGAAILTMLRSAGGANSGEMEKATGWKAASVRGYLGTLRAGGFDVHAKKLGKGEPVVYRLHEAKAPPVDVGDVV